MSPFTDAEIAYMGRITLARLATIGTDGRPHVIPLTYHYNPDEDAIDIGGGFDKAFDRDLLGVIIAANEVIRREGGPTWCRVRLRTSAKCCSAIRACEW